MVANNQKRKTDNLGRRKKTLLKKVYELGKYYDVDVALVIRQNNQYTTYRSIDLESFPPAMKEIVRLCLFIDLTLLMVMQLDSYPVPKNVLPQDIENQLQDSKKQAHDK
jgi:hypothetical protein